MLNNPGMIRSASSGCELSAIPRCQLFGFTPTHASLIRVELIQSEIFKQGQGLNPGPEQ